MKDVSRARLTLQQYVKKHWKLNGVTDNLRGTENIIDKALLVNEQLELNIEPLDIMITCYIIGMWRYQKERQPYLSSLVCLSIVRELAKDIGHELTSYRAMDMARACKEFKIDHAGGYSSNLSEVISAANRSCTSLERIYYINYKYGMDKLKLPYQTALRYAKNIMLEKHGYVSSVQASTIYKEYFLDELNSRIREIRTLDDVEIELIIGNYSEEYEYGILH